MATSPPLQQKEDQFENLPEDQFENLPEDQFDKLPDAMILHILGFLPEAKSLGRCSAVSRRLRSLCSQVDSLVLRVDCVLPHPNQPCGTHENSSSKQRPPSLLSRLSRFFFSALNHLLPLPSTKQTTNSNSTNSNSTTTATLLPQDHHSPSQVLQSFPSLRHLRIELPTSELSPTSDGSLLRWSASFGSSLRRCTILAATSSHTTPSKKPSSASAADDLCSNGGLRSRVVWTISSLIAASARHHLLRPIVVDSNTSLRSLEMVDADGLGVLRMDATDLADLRAAPPAPPSPARRTPVPALSMKLWYAPWLEIPGGVSLEGATLVAITPTGADEDGEEWVAEAFADKTYAAAAGILMKGKAYFLEMNSF